MKHFEKGKQKYLDVEQHELTSKRRTTNNIADDSFPKPPDLVTETLIGIKTKTLDLKNPRKPYYVNE